MRLDQHAAKTAVIIFHNDDVTPLESVLDILSRLFGKSESEARQVANGIHNNGEALVGEFPLAVAKALGEELKRRIEIDQLTLRFSMVTSHPELPTDAYAACGFCGKTIGAMPAFRKQGASICAACVEDAANGLFTPGNEEAFKFAHRAIKLFFAGTAVVSSSRVFPGHMRADVQIALNELFKDAFKCFGIHEEHRYETLTYSHLVGAGRQSPQIAPLQYIDVDTGEFQPVQCLSNALWLCYEETVPYAALLSEHREFGAQAGIRIEFAVQSGESGAAITQRAFAAIEASVKQSTSYRGKVISLEKSENYRGKSNGVSIQKMPKVSRQELILQPQTIEMLDRTVLQFASQRDALRELGFSTRKGILLYGPPGTGKTHTIRYLVSSLPDHTTLTISAEQVGLLSDYMQLARLLQPSLVVIEDADLIAREREKMSGPCEESLLNKLLNEMDGLKEDADIFFVLTTNNPEQLETALSGRPGRIDQAIEIALPDAACRRQLIQLYSGKLHVPSAVLESAVGSTDGVSAAFIKELMRRVAQAKIDAQDYVVSEQDFRRVVEEIMFTGGQLNAKMLGAGIRAR
jgi:AAA+ superfamily predicted ATPase/ATP-dependent Clp protease adapter protein ClpS